MTVNARTEEFQHVELLGKYALFTNGRIDRSTVPEGWYCYDFRGSDDDPGELRYIEESVAVNHAGSILMPEKLEFPASGRLDVRDEFGFLDEGEMTLHEFCEVHELPYPAEEEQYHIRPAHPDEAGLFYGADVTEDADADSVISSPVPDGDGVIREGDLVRRFSSEAVRLIRHLGPAPVSLLIFPEAESTSFF